MTVLTARGKSLEEIERPPDETDRFAEWDVELQKLLVVSVEWGKARQRADKRRVWCRKNWAHSEISERTAQLREAVDEQNAIGSRVIATMDRVSQIQSQMAQTELDGISVLIGHPVWPAVAGVWSARAAELQTTDLFRIACDVHQMLYDPDRWERRNDPCRVCLEDGEAETNERS